MHKEEQKYGLAKQQKNNWRVFIRSPEPNSFVHVHGIGWKLLWADHDCQSEAMTVMASHACNDNRTVNLFEENGKVKILYVW